MATTFDFNVLKRYGGDRREETDASVLPGTQTLSDSNSSGTFTVNETLSTAPIDGELPGTLQFRGTITVNIDGADYIFLVLQEPLNNDRFVVGFVPDTSAAVIDASMPDRLPRNPSLDGRDPANPFVPCFMAGTLIATPQGERAVETLAIGDLVLAADGRAVPVRWMGRKTVHKATAPAHDFGPVRVTAGALGAGLPVADLLLTGDHALIVDGLAVNASALVNGTTIVWEPAADLPSSITYWHIETEAHEEILANGAAAETFVDYVGRSHFDNHQEYLDLYGCERIIPEMKRPRISARRQLPADLAARFGIGSFGEAVEAEFEVRLAG